MAQMSSGLVTDLSWKCTNQIQQNLEWTSITFNDTGWPSAVSYGSNGGGEIFGTPLAQFASERLWISIRNPIVVGKIYCRKSRMK